LVNNNSGGGLKKYTVHVSVPGLMVEEKCGTIISFGVTGSKNMPDDSWQLALLAKPEGLAINSRYQLTVHCIGNVFLFRVKYSFE